MVGLVLARADVRRDVEIGLSLGLIPSQFDAVADGDRELLQAAWQADRQVCDQHGGDVSECNHKTWYPHRTVCTPAMAKAAAEARYDELHDEQPYHDGTFTRWSSKRSKDTPAHYRDGVTISVHREDLDPDHDFLKGG